MKTALIDELLSKASCQWCGMSISSCVVDLPQSAPSNLPSSSFRIHCPTKDSSDLGHCWSERDRAKIFGDISRRVGLGNWDNVPDSGYNTVTDRTVKNSK